MIQQIDIAGDGVTLSDDLQKYIRRRIGRLDRFAPRAARRSMHATVRMRENNQGNNKYECHVVLHVPHQQIVAEEATVNMFAAVDIVETKLKNQLQRHKSQQTGKRGWSIERVLSRLRRLTPDATSDKELSRK